MIVEVTHKNEEATEVTRVARIAEVRNEYLKIHFEGWPYHEDYWCLPDSTDVHPYCWHSMYQKTFEKPRGL